MTLFFHWMSLQFEKDAFQISKHELHIQANRLLEQCDIVAATLSSCAQTTLDRLRQVCFYSKSAAWLVFINYLILQIVCYALLLLSRIMK